MTRRSRSEYNWSKLQFDETILRKHITSPRRGKIKFVVAHHMTIIGKGTGSANDACYNVWQSRPASAHYGVDGTHVRQFVWDSNAAWSTANTTGNHSGISIEHANSTAGPSWRIAEDTWKTGAKLAGHLHKAYGLGRPVSGKTLRKHREFFATACPGPYMDSIWGQYVREAQRAYDEITNSTPDKPAPKPKPQLARWFTHSHLNTWGDDGGEGTRTLASRVPAMVRDLTKDEPEVITLNEVRSSQVSAWRKALGNAGYRVVLADAGNLVAVINGTKIKYAGTYVLPKKVQGEGRKEALGRVRAHVNGHWVHIGVTHFDYRPGARFDSLRVKQAKSVIAAMRRFAIRYVLPTWKTRTSIGVDENSRAWTRDRAFVPAKLPAAVKSGIDGIYGARPAIDTATTNTSSDHPIVSVTYGKKA